MLIAFDESVSYHIHFVVLWGANRAIGPGTNRLKVGVALGDYPIRVVYDFSVVAVGDPVETRIQMIHLHVVTMSGHLWKSYISYFLSTVTPLSLHIISLSADRNSSRPDVRIANECFRLKPKHEIFLANKFQPTFYIYTKLKVQLWTKTMTTVVF